MSDHIPFSIQMEIMTRLPVKSLVQFRCVSKAWKSLIDSSEFLAAHGLRRRTQPHYLLVSYGNPAVEEEYVCFVDDHTFPQQRSVPELPISVKQLTLATVIGTSHGLICFHGFHPNYTTKIAVIWNPSIRKSTVVAVPGEPSVAFVVCPVTSNPKIVSITQSQDFDHCEAMIYSLSSRKWKPSSNLPAIPIRDAWSPVVTERFIYWIAGITPNMIMSFDVTEETFKIVDLPESVARNPPRCFSILLVRESLAMLENRGNTCTVVWMMEDEGSFTKLFTIEAPEDSIVGFRRNGVPIMVVEDGDGPPKFVVYEPNSEHDNVIEISGASYWFNMISYMETLLLLNSY